MNLKITKVQLVCVGSTDELYFEFEGESPFPDMGYAPHGTIQVLKGHGETYAKKLGWKLDRVIRMPSMVDGKHT